MIDSFIPYLPNLNGTDGQRIIYNLEEFRSLEASEDPEKLNGPGTYYKHQILVQRLMNDLDKLFIIHEPGSGKTCTVIGYTELLKKDSNVIDGIIYITSPRLIQSVKNQILCKCTNGTYINNKILNAANSKSLTTNITNSIKKWYDIKSYGDFAKEIQGKTSIQLRKDFSGKSINIDEVAEIIKLTEFKSLLNFHHDFKRVDESETMNSEFQYIQYWRLLQSVERCKIIIATATPIQNEAPELLMLCNLLLPHDNQIDVAYLSKKMTDQPINPPIDRILYNYDFTNLKTYEPYFNKMFSYINAPNTGAYPNYIGSSFNVEYSYPQPITEDGQIGDKAEWSSNPQWIVKKIESQIVIFKVELFSYQAELYHSEINGKLRKNSFYVVEDEISSYVDPLNGIGNDAKYDAAFFSDTVNGSLNRNQTASKFNFIYEQESRLYRETNGKPGFSFVYIKLTNTGGVALKNIFIANGYETLDISDIPVSDMKVCATGNITRVNLQKKKRIVFLDSDDPIPERERILAICSSKENVNGEYIQMLIGSNILGIGINIGNAVRFYRADPEWNEANEKQSRDRVFRADSYNYVRGQIIEKRKSEGNYISSDEIAIPVDFYNISTYARYYTLLTSNLPSYNNREVLIEREMNVRINSRYLMYLVGFVKNDDTFPYQGKVFLSLFPTQNELPWKLLNLEYPDENELMGRIEASVGAVISISGCLYKVDLNAFIDDYALVIAEKGDYNEKFNIGFYENLFYLYTRNTNDQILIPLSMEVRSANESKYLYTERKSIPEKKFVRYAKQYATDCLVNYQRTYKKDYNDTIVDGSVECDFDRCKYSCVTNIAGENKSILDPTLYNLDSPFWDNYEILYSQPIIEECEKTIVNMVFNKGIVTSGEIEKALSSKYRQYFIYEAIYSIVTNKNDYRDSFGFICYIAVDGDSLFLKREYPANTTSNVGYYINRIIGVTNNVQFNLDETKDQELIAKIENIPVPISSNPNDPNDKILITNNLIYDINNEVNTFAIYKSNIDLLEQSLTRLIEKNQKPIDIYIYEVYRPNIYRLDDGTYVHNFPRDSPSKPKFAKYNIYIKAESPFRIFRNGEWVDANLEEQKKLQSIAFSQHQQEIQTLLSEHGNPRFYLYCIKIGNKNEYYLVDSENKQSTGRDASNLSDDILAAISNYFQIGEPFVKNNYKNRIVPFFRDLGLIYVFSSTPGG